ncbi:MAG: helix-turn-helix transcriptional regulator [Caldilineaceae bacterium]|nr:helix-turn-helix transcriptional regulator [Caldilineaceae bacterium]
MMIEIPPQRFTDLNKLSLPITLGSFVGDFLYWGYFPAEDWRNYLHIHSFFEVCYAFAGRGLFRIGGQARHIQAGDLFVAKPSEPHEIIADRAAPLGIYFWAYTLLPRGQASPPEGARKKNASPSQAGNPTTATTELDTLLHSFSESAAWISPQTSAIPELLRLLTREVALRRPGYWQSIQHLATTLLIETARAVTQPPPTTPSLPESNSEAVGKMLRYLKDNYTRPLQVRDIAAQLHLSERHTSRLFRQATGLTLQAYLTRLRLTLAKQYLLDPTLSIAEVAEATGYQDARYFATLFRRQTGITPSAFRQRRGTEFLP